MATLETAKNTVDQLYSFRDNYFAEHGMEGAATKTSNVKQKLEETLVTLNTLSEELKMKAEYLMLRGKALNVMPSYDSEAEENLAKAVKLDPKLVEAWVVLGECYWKNGQVELAQNCFVGALNHSKHKVALRNLSMVIRHIGKDPAERAANIEESISKAKEAVQLDITDGTSWFVLGTAYLSQFFAVSQSPTAMKQCLTAYQHAEKDSVANSNPDLHHNRAIMYEFQEDYELALIGYSRAASLDPTFTEPSEKRTLLLQYLSKCLELIQTKGKIRSKKLHSMVESIDIKSGLGPYNGSFCSASGETANLEILLLNQLKQGSNSNKVVLGKVVCSVSSGQCFTFCMVDKMTTCYRVTVYNITSGWGVKIGDTVAIAEPFVKHINVMLPNESVEFESIRVESPVVLVVNGHKLTKEVQAPSILTIQTRSE